MSTTLWNSVVGHTLSGADLILRHPPAGPAGRPPVVLYGRHGTVTFSEPSPIEAAARWFPWEWEALQAATWFPEAKRKLNDLLRLPADWDHQGACPISVAVAARALLLLFASVDTQSRLPHLVPTFEGGIQVEWHARGIDLEVEIHPDRRVDLFVFEAASGKEVSGDFWENLSEFDSTLAKLHG